MQIVSAQDVARYLSWNGVIRRLHHTFLNGVESPPRHHHAINRPDGEATMLLMPAWETAGYIGVKMVNVFPQNADHGIPAISGLYLLSEGQHGKPLACIDGSELTRRRTAAASALAAQALANENAETLLVVGTGKLAPMVIEAHASVLPIKRVLVWGRNQSKAAVIADEYADRFETQVVASLPDAVTQADIVSCVTLSTQPIIKGEWLKPGTHLDLIGAFRPQMRETDSECLRRAEVFVDTYAGAKGEAGDILQAIEEEGFCFDEVRGELKEVLAGTQPGRTSEHAITLFKSVGASLEDLAAAIELWESLPRSSN